MKRIDEIYNYKDYQIHVFRGLANAEDSNWNGEIILKLSKLGENIRGELKLMPLWYFDEEQEEDVQYKYKEQYNVGDYFQQTFTSEPKRKGIGSTLHDFIIDHKTDLEIANVFSTKSEEDGHGISVDAESFWQNRILQDNAEEDEDVDRHKIKFD
jgi:hypothetical protein